MAWVLLFIISDVLLSVVLDVRGRGALLATGNAPFFYPLGHPQNRGCRLLSDRITLRAHQTTVISPKENIMEEKKPMTVREAGRLGGEATKRRQMSRDPDFYQRIGRMGGRKSRQMAEHSKTETS
jgi:general stress protein YciG